MMASTQNATHAREDKLVCLGGLDITKLRKQLAAVRKQIEENGLLGKYVIRRQRRR